MINSSRDAEPARCESVRYLRIKYYSKRPTTFRCLLPFRFGAYGNVVNFRDHGRYPHKVKFKQWTLVRFWNATRRSMVEWMSNQLMADWDRTRFQSDFFWIALIDSFLPA